MNDLLRFKKSKQFIENKIHIIKYSISVKTRDVF